MGKKVFIGQAWPYANGSLHLGHVAAFIGADILARYHRLAGDDVLFVSGSDCYGTPIAIEAAEKNINPSDIVDRYHEEFRHNLIEDLGFSYDIYTRTNDTNHTHVVQELFLDLYTKEYLYLKVEKALYSPFLKRFLPDRFIEGICPKCNYDGARGDQCDECQSLLDPLELKYPRINSNLLKNYNDLSLKDKRLEVRDSEHFYLRLSKVEKELEKWIQQKSNSWRVNARKFTLNFLKQGLQDRAITRDTDWGVPIPLPGYTSKKIYVWFEAVCGYLSASKKWAKDNGTPNLWKQWWQNRKSVHYYVHGKDNILFHTIILPAILVADGTLNKPDHIVSSEYLNLEGKQFSKSRKWAVWVPEFLKEFDPETLRYFLITHGPETKDSSFYWLKYAQSVNGELIGTLGNLVNRVFSFSKNKFPNGVRFPENLDKESNTLLTEINEAFPKIGALIKKSQFRAAFRLALQIAEKSNIYIDTKAPWSKMKSKTTYHEAEQELAVLIQAIRSLAILISPFLPKTSEKIYDFLGLQIKNELWKYPKPKTTFKVLNINPLYHKIEDTQIEQQLLKLKDISSDK